MTNRIPFLAFSLVCVILAGVLVVATPASAQSLQDKIDQGLRKRSITIPPPQPDDPKAKEQKQFIEGLRKRSIVVEPREPVAPAEREKLAVIAKERPAIDLQIFFDYDSAELGPKAQPTLIALGNVLSKPDFKGTVFLINGHTDARGSAEYNQQLSERRAAAVRRALIEQFKLAPDTLIAAGFGKEQLKVPGQPFAGENRRVEIVNTEQK